MSRGKAYTPSNDKNYWRNVRGYNGKYQVSRLGEIRRVYNSGKVANMTPYRKSGKQFRNRLFVKLTKDAKSKEEPVLQVVATAWCGETPAGKVPYHINGIVTDNRADNIGFIDRETLGRKTGAKADRRKTVFKIDASGNVIEIYRSAREAAKANFMSYQTVLDRCHGKVKKPYALNGYTFIFEDNPKKGGRKNGKAQEIASNNVSQLQATPQMPRMGQALTVPGFQTSGKQQGGKT